MDDADRADAVQQIFIKARLSECHQQAQVSIEGDGWCRVCGNDVEPINYRGRLLTPRWCSLECRERDDG